MKEDLEDQLRSFPIASLELREILNAAADELEHLRLENVNLKIQLSHSKATIKKFVDPDKLRAYIKYADEFQEHGPYKTLTYEQWFKREYK